MSSIKKLYVTTDKYGDENMRTGNIVLTVVGGFFALCFLFGSFTTVGPGERGVMVKVFWCWSVASG